MEINGNKITFEVDEKTLDVFKLTLKILDLDPDKAFTIFTKDLRRRALRMENAYDMPVSSSNNRIEFIGTQKYTIASKLDDERVRSRIERWARNKFGFAYKMLKAFFKIYDSNPEHVVTRDEMFNIYKVLCEQNVDEIKYRALFILTFRQMCSDSARAYGSIFKYDNKDGKDIVELNPVYKEFVLSLKEEFTY